MKNFDIAILGNGASGCMCAMVAGDSKKSIALIDKNKTPAKKLMATGNGRCNLTNSNCVSSKKFFNQNIDNFLTRFSVSDTLTFFENLGLMHYSDNEGRVYPISNNAKSVVDVISNKLKKMKNISFFNENTVEKIEKEGEKFKIHLNDEIIFAEKVVIATGGNCTHLIENLGVNTRKASPSLCALKTEKKIKILNNIKISNVKVTAKSEKSKKEFSEIGEVLFKENGLSGIVVFNASTMFARENSFLGEISIDLMPSINLETLKELLSNRRTLDVKISNFFDGMFINNIGYYLLEQCHINEDRTSLKLTDEEITKLANTIKSLKFKIIDSLENNQVFSGGALIEGLTENLECKNCKNLFISGEACDIDGQCGGFNLQWAWTSGYTIGEYLRT